MLYLAAPLFAGYKKRDYWVYRAMVQGLIGDLLPQPRLIPVGPGWVEYTLHDQASTASNPRRQMVHVIAYQPRRTLQPIPHVDQAWPVSGLGFKVRTDMRPTARLSGAGWDRLDYTLEGGYVHVDLPPLHVYAVVVLEF